MGEAIAAIDGYTGHDAAVRTRDRLRAARARRVRAVGARAHAASRAPSSTPTISQKAKVLGRVAGVNARDASSARCSTIRTATATSRRRSSCSSGAAADPIRCSTAAPRERALHARPAVWVARSAFAVVGARCGVGAAAARCSGSQLRQHAYEDAPRDASGEDAERRRWAASSSSLALLAASARLRDAAARSTALSCSSSSCAAIGFVDDCLAIRSGSNRGLRARTKFLATALVAVIVPARGSTRSYAFFPRDVLFHAGSFALTAPHWLWLLLGIARDHRNDSRGESHRRPRRLGGRHDDSAARRRSRRSLRRRASPAARSPRASASARARDSCSTTGIRPRSSWATRARSRSARCSRASRSSPARCCC